MADIRVQLISEKQFIAELKKSGEKDWKTVSDHKLPESDQQFGIGEVAAIIAVATSLAKLCEIIVRTWKLSKNKTSLTIKTPKGSITVNSEDAKNAEKLIEQLKPILD